MEREKVRDVTINGVVVHVTDTMLFNCIKDLMESGDSFDFRSKHPSALGSMLASGEIFLGGIFPCFVFELSPAGNALKQLLEDKSKQITDSTEHPLCKLGF